jgi:hypothetical protein
MGRNDGGRPAAYVVTPDRRLPEWQVEVELHSSPLPHRDPDKTWHDWVEHFSSVSMVFFCGDLSRATLTEPCTTFTNTHDIVRWTCDSSIVGE